MFAVDLTNGQLTPNNNTPLLAQALSGEDADTTFMCKRCPTPRLVLYLECSYNSIHMHKHFDHIPGMVFEIYVYANCPALNHRAIQNDIQQQVNITSLINIIP